MTAPRALAFLSGELERLESVGLRRSSAWSERARLSGGILLCANDYLGLASSDDLMGAGASPVVVGTHPEHLELQDAFASWLGAETALLFPSGYAANLGALGALVGAGDTIVSDALNHASIIDGARLARASVLVVPHLDLGATERALRESATSRRRLVVVESCYSMDGDRPDLLALRSLCDRHDAILYVDEAHGLGVFGPEGRGVCAEVGVVPDVLVAPLGKAFGLQGAIIAGCVELTDWLWNRARSLIYSTAISPTLARSALARLEHVRGADDLRRRLLDRSNALRDRLEQTTGVRPPGVGPIVPWILGTPTQAIRASTLLEERGVVVLPIRPPTVPEGSSRLRLTVSAGMPDSTWQTCLTVIEHVARTIVRDTTSRGSDRHTLENRCDDESS